MRAFGDRDVLLATDLVIKRELARRRITSTAEWAPFRSYATMHLWFGLTWRADLARDRRQTVLTRSRRQWTNAAQGWWCAGSSGDGRPRPAAGYR